MRQLAEHGYDEVENTKDEDPTGLLNEGFRYRDLETGVFITRDPLGFVDSNSNIMMPKEKWMVDGKEVTVQEYARTSQPGVPQAGNGPTKTAKDSGQEADAHVAGSEEGAVPGQKSHMHTAAAGFPNLYTYVNENPWTFFDPEGLRDVIVNIWNAEAPYVFAGGSVGHAEVQEMNGKTLLSQFPNPHGSHGANTTLDHAATVKKEGREPDEVYKVYVPNDAKFDAAVKDHTSRKSWDKHPAGNKDETNCVVSTADALRQGGVKTVTSHLLPGNLGSELNHQSTLKPGQNGSWVSKVPKPAPTPVPKP